MGAGVTLRSTRTQAIGRRTAAAILAAFATVLLSATSPASAATPAPAATTPSLGLKPDSGPPGSKFTADYHSGLTASTCTTKTAQFRWDSSALGQAQSLDAQCNALGVSLSVPDGATTGPHSVTAQVGSDQGTQAGTGFTATPTPTPTPAPT